MIITAVTPVFSHRRSHGMYQISIDPNPDTVVLNVELDGIITGNGDVHFPIAVSNKRLGFLVHALGVVGFGQIIIVNEYRIVPV